MCTQKELEQILKKMIMVYRNVYKDAVEEIYLYGSYARRDYTSESDIDIVAIVKGNRVTLQEQLKKIWDIASDIGLDYEVVVSPTVIPHNEFENYKNILPYYRNILEEGVKISAWLSERTDVLSIGNSKGEASFCKDFIGCRRL